MKYRTTFSLGLVALLAACGQQSETAEPAEATPTATEASAMSSMAPEASSEAQGVSATGIITAVDEVAGTVTIEHEAIPAIDWPAMTMGFKAAPEVLTGVKAGDKVSFDLKLQNGSGEVTSIKQQ